MRTNTAYIKDKAFSNSDLKLFEDNITEFYRCKMLDQPMEDEKSNKGIELGDIVDILTTDKANFSELFYETDFSMNESKIKTVMDKLFKSMSNSDYSAPVALPLYIKFLPEFSKKELIKVIEEENYFANRSNIDSRVATALADGSEYFNHLIKSNGKRIVSHADVKKAEQLVDLAKESVGFEVLKSETLPGTTILRKHVTAANYNGFEIKAEIDTVEITDDWVQGYDIKTAESHKRFVSNYYNFKYGRQGSFYNRILAENFPQHEIKPFKFLVIPTKSRESPEVYQMTSDEISNCEYGYHTSSGKEIKGFRQLLNDILWHTKTNNWLHRKEYYENGNLNLLAPANKIAVEDLFV